MMRTAVYRIQMTEDGGENWNTLPGRFDSAESAASECEIMRIVAHEDCRFSWYYDHDATMRANAKLRGLTVVKDGWCLAYAH